MSPVPAATTTVEDHTLETLARRLRAHLQALAQIGREHAVLHHA